MKKRENCMIEVERKRLRGESSLRVEVVKALTLRIFLVVGEIVDLSFPSVVVALMMIWVVLEILEDSEVMDSEVGEDKEEERRKNSIKLI